MPKKDTLSGSLASFYPPMVRAAVGLFDHPDAVRKVDPDHWEVLNPSTPSRRVKVFRKGDDLRCHADKKDYSQDKPCRHILAVMFYEGLVDLPNTANTVWSKGKEDRPSALEAQAWRAVPTRLPELLADLLREGLPSLAPLQEPTSGRPRKPAYPQVYQAVMRVALRMSLQAAQGAMRGRDHRVHNPYGPVGAATLSRFLAKAETKDILEKLLALSTYPARPYETIAHPDGTGLSEQHFSTYFEERPKNRYPPKQDQAVADVVRDENPGPRTHSWTYTEILWTYRYTMIAAIYSADGPFGEAPWLIPLLERAGLVFDLKELGGDKAYNSYYLFDYAKRNGIEPQMKFKANANPTQSHARKKAYKRTYEAMRLDPKGYAAKANRRNNAETGNHAFKAILGSEVYNRGHLNDDGTRDFTSRANEVLCMALAYNLTRLVFLELHQGIQIDFAPGAMVLAAAPWEGLDSLHRRFYKSAVPVT
jgi:hypothetical protein